jgi:ubiquinone/menaquinone biosynthesis C-methylase UbiE
VGGEPYWDSVAPRYNALYESDWARFENDALRDNLAKLLPDFSGKRVLDIGCGTGLGYELLRDLDPEIQYVGLDPSAAMLLEFKKKHPDATTVRASGDALTMFFPADRFDLIIAINVAASFPIDTRLMLSEIFNVLAPGGIIYLSFLNRHSLRRITHGDIGTSERYRTRGDDDERQFVWARAYTKSELRQMCRDVGFSKIRCHYQSVLGGVWESKTSLKMERLLIKITPCLGHSIAVTGILQK